MMEKRRLFEIVYEPHVIKIPEKEYVNLDISSILERHRKRHRKDRLTSKAAMLHSMESNINIKRNNRSHKIPVTANGEQSETCDHLCNWKVEENQKLCTQKHSSYLKQKQHKHEESEINAGGSRVPHEISETDNVEVSGSSYEENENVCIQKDSLQLDQKKDKPKESKAISSAQSEHEFACPTCFKNFDNRSNFIRHLLIHREKKLFSCTVCEKSFTLKQSLQVHLRSHTQEKPFKCAECSKPFSDLNNLRRHRLIHNKLKKFVCNTCGKAFSLKHHLESHMLTHEDKKLFPCPHCYRIFNYEYRLRIHLDACKKLNPLICIICSNHFPRVYNLKRHMRTHD